MRRALLLLTLAFTSATVQTPGPSMAQTPEVDLLAPLDFLVGTWTAVTNTPAGTSGAAVTGTYTFRRDLNGHILSRTSSSDTCKGPRDFDCSHHDQLTIFADLTAQAAHHAILFAFYADSEGHILYYSISTPDPHTAVFTSQAPATAPHFRLIYHLEGVGTQAIMTGKFQGTAPGSDEFHSYLEWSGRRQPSF